MMRRVALFALLMMLCLAAHAQTCPEGASYAKAREVVRDLDRIAAPEGIQETYALHVGGIDQWVNVRGQDRSNPVIFFVHGGPASPVMPTMWQFQRPLEEYFTVVNYDQRGAGKTFRGNDPAADRHDMSKSARPKVASFQVGRQAAREPTGGGCCA